jgi:hypothetical protein
VPELRIAAERRDRRERRGRPRAFHSATARLSATTADVLMASS